MASASALDLDTASALSQGARDYQEDAVATAFEAGADIGFAVLSDGMGGHAAGDLASRLIVSEMYAALTLRGRDPQLPSSRIPAMLNHAVEMANESLRAHVLDDPKSAGMGGTVVATLISDGQLYWISVGDSLLLLLRDGTLKRLNQDHSMAPQIDMMVREGLIDAEAGRDHPQRHCLISALAGDEIEKIDCPEAPLRLLPGDVVLLASDGLLSLPDDQIEAIVCRDAKRQSDAIAQDLISAVGSVGDPDQDNTSIVVIKTAPGKFGQLPVALSSEETGLRRAYARAMAPVRQLMVRG